MFKKKPLAIGQLVRENLRTNGLETPLQQHRLIALWDEVMGPTVAGCTKNKFIKNQTLFVQLSSPSLRANLQMMRSRLVQRLNASVGSFVIADIRFY